MVKDQTPQTLVDENYKLISTKSGIRVIFMIVDGIFKQLGQAGKPCPGF